MVAPAGARSPVSVRTYQAPIVGFKSTSVATPARPSAVRMAVDWTCRNGCKSTIVRGASARGAPPIESATAMIAALRPILVLSCASARGAMRFRHGGTRHGCARQSASSAPEEVKAAQLHDELDQ